MVGRCMRTDSSRCDPSHITLDLWSLVIWLGSHFEESFLTHTCQPYGFLLVQCILVTLYLYV